jgi:hypothetical protein
MTLVLVCRVLRFGIDFGVYFHVGEVEGMDFAGEFIPILNNKRFRIHEKSGLFSEFDVKTTMIKN